MVREDDILLILFNNPWFSPSKNGETKALTNEQGNPIVGDDGKQIEAPLSYYHICSNGNRITIRVSNHGTALNTWGCFAKINTLTYIMLNNSIIQIPYTIVDGIITVAFDVNT